jgi:hypothetical protein
MGYSKNREYRGSTSLPRCIFELTSGKSAVFVLVLLCVARAGLGAQESTRRYTETHGQKVITIEYRVTRAAEEVTASSTGGDTTELVSWHEGAGTIDWQMTDPAAGSVFHGRRNGDVIHVTGTLKNRKVDRDVRVDKAPWYQVFGPLLDELLPAGVDQKEFWVVDPGDLAPHKMQVKRAGAERIMIKGTAIDAVRVHFSPAGALAPFWGADFWYRQSDEMYVSSRLPENGGVTLTTIEDPDK